MIYLYNSLINKSYYNVYWRLIKLFWFSYYRKSNDEVAMFAKELGKIKNTSSDMKDVLKYFTKRYKFLFSQKNIILAYSMYKIVFSLKILKI